MADVQDDFESILLLKNAAEKEYNNARRELNYRVGMYFRQDIQSTYITEERLQKLLDDCVSAKKKYFEYRNMILGREVDILHVS